MMYDRGLEFRLVLSAPPDYFDTVPDLEKATRRRVWLSGDTVTVLTIKETDGRLLESQYFKDRRGPVGRDADTQVTWWDYRDRSDRLDHAPIDMTPEEEEFLDQLTSRLDVVDAAWYDIGRTF